MATMVKLWINRQQLVDEFYQRIGEAECCRQLEYDAAVSIQSWFRAVRVRTYLKILNCAAIKIQKRWRGVLGRQRFREIIRMKVWTMRFQFYTKMATRIQALWRGYYSRKYYFNFYSRKKYFQGLELKNQIVRNEIQEKVNQLAQAKKWREEDQKERDSKEFARKHHYLVSTEAIPGIYNSPCCPMPNEIEFLLRQTKPEKSDFKTKRECKSYFDPSWSKYDKSLHYPLPPLIKKPQGPFRDPRDVQYQRYRPFNPTLRVETEIDSVEKARTKMKQIEWVNRVIDDIFLPSRKPAYEPYQPLLISSNTYGRIPYGNRHFREEYRQCWAEDNFRTIVPPIPVFEKFNKTYSMGEV